MTDLKATRQDNILVYRALKDYELYKSDGYFINNFSEEDREKLQILDKKFDIPLLTLYYSDMNYKTFHKLYEQGYRCIPIDKNDVILDINEFCKNCTVDEFEWLIKAGVIDLNTEKLEYSLALNGNLECFEHLSRILNY